MMLTASSLAELKERILSRCEWQDGPLDTPCLIYTGTLSRDGYGRIGYQGHVLETYRAIWICEHGEVEEGKEICHNCHSPACNNILHLRADTHAANVADMFSSGRCPNRQGEYQSLLTAIQVSHIKYFLQLGWTAAQLAERYFVSRSTISMIGSGINWTHVQPYQPIPGKPLPVLPLTAPVFRRF